MAKAPRLPRPDADPRSPKRRSDLKPGECLCDHCVGKCCRYFSLPIETPQTWDDYDAIRWYLAHGRTLVYVDEGVWHLLVMTRCQYLTSEDRCRIYLSRPRICQEYTTDSCEYDDDWTFERAFEAPDQIMEYAEAILSPHPPPPPKRRGAAAIVFDIEPKPPRSPASKTEAGDHSP